MSDITVTYCTPEDVAETLDLPDPHNKQGYLTFTPQSHPSYDRVCKMILANEGQIDTRSKRTWREHQVKDKLLSISTYWLDENGWRTQYFREGGNYVQLRRNVREWDPSKGDKLELRTANNLWVDISNEIDSTYMSSTPDTKTVSGRFWFDYEYGKLYLRHNRMQTLPNSLRITYRYGSEEDVPWEVNRLCCLMTARQILNMQAFYVKIGQSGDLGNPKEAMMREWKEEEGALWASIQRASKVVSMYR